MHAAGQIAHSSNASGPPAALGPPLDRPPSKTSHDGSLEDRAAGESAACAVPSQTAAGAAGTAGPQDPASVDEVLKHFLQSNDKLASLSLSRFNMDTHGRLDGEAASVRSVLLNLIPPPPQSNLNMAMWCTPSCRCQSLHAY